MRISYWSSDVCSSDLLGLQQARRRLDGDGVASQLAHDQRGHAARAVAAGAYLAAVVVPDAHEHVGAAVRRPLQDQELIAAHALAAVGNGLGQAVRQRKRLLAGVDHDEILATTVHIAEGGPAPGGGIGWTGRAGHQYFRWRRRERKGGVW